MKTGTRLVALGVTAGLLGLLPSAVFSGERSPHYTDVIVKTSQYNLYQLDLPIGADLRDSQAFERGDALDSAARTVCPLGYEQVRVLESTGEAPFVRWEITCHLGVSKFGIAF